MLTRALDATTTHYSIYTHSSHLIFPAQFYKSRPMRGDYILVYNSYSPPDTDRHFGPPKLGYYFRKISLLEFVISTIALDWIRNLPIRFEIWKNVKKTFIFLKKKNNKTNKLLFWCLVDFGIKNQRRIKMIESLYYSRNSNQHFFVLSIKSFNLTGSRLESFTKALEYLI